MKMKDNIRLFTLNATLLTFFAFDFYNHII